MEVNDFPDQHMPIRSISHDVREEDEEGDCVFMTMVHLVDPHHFVHVSSMVSRCLVEVFAKNSKPKGFQDIVPTSFHTYANVFSQMAFNSLPERHKWDHAIEQDHDVVFTDLLGSAR
jgi:hypothetical protein